MMTIETEAKFRVNDFLQVRARLASLGAERISGIFEHNIVFDDGKGTLKSNDMLLRLREGNKAARLTYKGPKFRKDMKSREEIEIEISDFDSAKLILQRLGFSGTRVYDKKRETWKYKSAEIELDELPFGKFVEIEGNENSIISVAEALGFSRKDIITKTYLELAEEAGMRGDIVFKKG